MKYQLFEDMKKTVQLNPNANHVLKIKAVDKPFDVALAYNCETKMYRVIVLKYDTKDVVKRSPWTNSYKVLGDYIKANKIKLTEYRG